MNAIYRSSTQRANNPYTAHTYNIDPVPGTGHCAEKDDQSPSEGVGHRRELITEVILDNKCYKENEKCVLTVAC